MSTFESSPNRAERPPPALLVMVTLGSPERSDTGRCVPPLLDHGSADAIASITQYIMNAPHEVSVQSWIIVCVVYLGKYAALKDMRRISYVTVNKSGMQV
jgi:hypothetical protein